MHYSLYVPVNLIVEWLPTNDEHPFFFWVLIKLGYITLLPSCPRGGFRRILCPKVSSDGPY